MDGRRMRAAEAAEEERRHRCSQVRWRWETAKGRGMGVVLCRRGGRSSNKAACSGSPEAQAAHYEILSPFQNTRNFYYKIYMPHPIKISRILERRK